MKDVINNLVDSVGLFLISILSSLFAFFDPAQYFIVAIVISFLFNILCGMRADGITITSWNDFKWSKFRNAGMEFLIYTLVIGVIYSIMRLSGDNDESLIALKILCYVLSYIYCLNGIKNLIIAYPKYKYLYVIYYILRFEFTKIAPSNIQPIIDHVNNVISTNNIKEDKNG